MNEKINNMLKIVTLCSGYDSQCLALNRLGIDYELIAWSEIDKYAIQAHDILFPQWKDRNLGDMTKIDWTKVPNFDLLTYSTPCQSVSNAGLQHGFTEGSGTRSSIIWYVREAIKVKKPKYLMLENVAAMVSAKFLPMFHLWQHELEKYGYTNYAQVLNAKDYGVPQNRERIFMISKLDDEPFYFPKPFKLEKRLKDILETSVDEKYYLNDKLVDTLSFNNKRLKETLEINQLPKKENVYIDAYNKTIKTDVSGTISTRVDASCCTFVSELRVNQVGNLIDDSNRDFKNPQVGKIYDSNDLCSTIDTTQGGSREPKIIEREPEVINPLKDKTKYGWYFEQQIYDESGITRTIKDGEGSGNIPKVGEPVCLNSKVNGKQPSVQDRIYDSNGISVAVTTSWIQNVVEPKIIEISSDEGIREFKDNICGTSRTIDSCVSKAIFETNCDHPRIRKLTPKECFRLMGVDDKDIDKLLNSGISNSQLYKLAGNSIVVDCMVYLFNKLLINKENEDKQLRLF